MPHARIVCLNDIINTAKKVIFHRGFCSGNVTGNTDLDFNGISLKLYVHDHSKGISFQEYIKIFRACFHVLKHQIF